MYKVNCTLTYKGYLPLIEITFHFICAHTHIHLNVTSIRDISILCPLSSLFLSSPLFSPHLSRGVSVSISVQLNAHNPNHESYFTELINFYCTIVSRSCVLSLGAAYCLLLLFVTFTASYFRRY